ncbi:MAG: ATP-binding protein [Spirochaetes bacterium]|nr:ATP-binding protein [Spirochaetota bacterium]
MITFEHQLNLIQFLIPPVCFGVLFSGFLYYIYMSYIYKSQLYASVAFLVLFGLIFVGSEIMILSFGSWMKKIEISLRFHQIEQLSGLYFLFALPYTLFHLLQLNRKWQAINKSIAITGLIFSVIVTIFAYIRPDTFISLTEHKATWLINEGDYGRGQEGVLYYIRDLLIGICLIYCITCFIIEIIRSRNIGYHIYPAVGLLLAFAGAVIDSVHVHTGVFYDFFQDYYFSRFTVCATIALLFFIFSVTKKFILSSKELEEAHKTISLSEEKYRFLVEGTNDCVFSMDKNLNLLRANKAVFKQLNVRSDNINNVNFYDLLSLDKDDTDMTYQVVKERMEFLSNKGKAVDFKAFFKSKGTMEPREYNVKIEKINIGGGNEILVKASNIPEDTIMKYIEREEAKLKIGNYLITADEISSRLVMNLPKYLDKKYVNNIKLGLREIIVNAIEHGNLDISFDEKTKSIEQGKYIQFLLSRQKEPSMRKKRIAIDYFLEKDHVSYTIKDQGNGFNHKKISRIIHESVDRDMLEHGRGLRMAYNIFDEIRFNRKGNQITLVKYFK